MCIAFQNSYGQAYESKVAYNKTQEAAVISEYTCPEEIVEKTLRDKLERMDYKIRNTRAFLVINIPTN